MLVHFIGLNLDLAKQANLFTVSIQQNSWIQTSQTGGQPYSDISPYEVNECSLMWLFGTVGTSPKAQKVAAALLLRSDFAFSGNFLSIKNVAIDFLHITSAATWPDLDRIQSLLSSELFLKNGPTPASFLFIFVLFRLKFYRNNCRLWRDSNSDWRIRRRAHWPLDHHHHGPSSDLLIFTLSLIGLCFIFEQSKTFHVPGDRTPNGFDDSCH